MKIKSFENDFPILKKLVSGQKLVYFDNAATTQKPEIVIEAIKNYYSSENANTHSEHFLAQELTNKIEICRQNVGRFLNTSSQNIVYTKGATESLNLVAQSYGFYNLKAGDEIIVSEQEHHANFVPWFELAKKLQLKFKVWRVQKDGSLSFQELENLITQKTKLLAITQVSNVLGTINPIKDIIDLCKQNQIISVVDGTQAAAHLDIDLHNLDPDFYVFSSHKMYGPMGIGVLYINPKIVGKLTPYQTGGEMVEDVSINQITYKNSPYLFEAGTLNFEGIVGLNQAIEYLNEKKLEGVFELEQTLINYLLKKLQKIPKIQILGSKDNKIPLLSFYFKDINSYDLASFLYQYGIAIRVGKHCAYPLLSALKLESVCRISLSFYNTKKEIDFFIEKLIKTLETFSRLS